jgi:hypothetical protein
VNHRILASMGLLAGAGLMATLLWPAPQGTAEPGHTPGSPRPATEGSERRGARISRMLMENPALDLEEAREIAERSARMQSQLDASGEGDVRVMLRQTSVTEAEARRYFEEHRALFGARSFEASRFAVERLAAIDRVGAELDIE